ASHAASTCMAATVRSFSPHYRSRPKCRRPLRPAGQPGGHSRPGFGFSARRLPPLSCRSMAFALTSPAFTDGSAVPAKYTCDGAAASRRLAERRGVGNAGPPTRHGPARGDLRAAEAMRLTFAVVLAGVALAPSFHVVVLPAAVRGVMGDLWVENNRHWDELAGQNTLTQLLGTGRPTQREYLACLEGEV